MQAAVPTSATFAAPFFIRPDPDEDDFFQVIGSSSASWRTDHERLDAYRIAREALVAGELVANGLPVEHEAVASELRRALVCSQLGVAHAATRGGSDRADRFHAARAEVARAAAALDAALVLGIAAPASVELTQTLLGRLSAMLVRLGARAQARR